jgi:excisionase family DNA binding protein
VSRDSGQTELLTPRGVVERYKAPRDLVYEALRDGRLRGIRRGSRWLIPTFSVERWLREETGAGDDE